jgi:hypothetical protein
MWANIDRILRSKKTTRKEVVLFGRLRLGGALSHVDRLAIRAILAKRMSLDPTELFLFRHVALPKAVTSHSTPKIVC